MSSVSEKDVQIKPQKKITTTSESVKSVSMKGEFLTSSTETGDELLYIESEE